MLFLLAFRSNVCKSGIRIGSRKYLNEYTPFWSVSLCEGWEEAHNIRFCSPPHEVIKGKYWIRHCLSVCPLASNNSKGFCQNLAIWHPGMPYAYSRYTCREDLGSTKSKGVCWVTLNIAWLLRCDSSLFCDHLCTPNHFRRLDNMGDLGECPPNFQTALKY